MRRMRAYSRRYCSGGPASWQAFFSGIFRPPARAASSPAALSRNHVVDGSPVKPQRRDERREKGEGEAAQANHLSVTDSQVTGIGLSLHCNSPSCSQAATNFPSPCKSECCIPFGGSSVFSGTGGIASRAAPEATPRPPSGHLVANR